MGGKSFRKAWGICSSGDDNYMIAAEVMGDIRGRRVLFRAYVFDREDGSLYTEPVSEWYVITRDARVNQGFCMFALDKMCAGIASGWKTPYDLRDERLRFDSIRDVPTGDRLLFL